MTSADVTAHEGGDNYSSEWEPGGSSRRVYVGIINDLEARRMVPGQRLVETDLSRRFAVGRNAVREAIQHLAARGVIDLSLNRSPAIRRLSLEETFDVLEVANIMTKLVVGRAADRFVPKHHGARLDELCKALVVAAEQYEDGAFSQARRQFYRELLAIGGNRELQRLFPAIGMYVFHAQYASKRLQDLRLNDYLRIARLVAQKEVLAAEKAVTDHIDSVRALITQQQAV